MLIAFHSVDHLTNLEGQAPVSLAPNAVHLWGMELNGLPPCFDRCFAWLNEEERHRAARFVREQDRRHYVFAHGGLRAVLSRYLGVSPALVNLGRTETGKPFVMGSTPTPSAITFNLSHAHGRALIAVSNAQEVGVDLELVRSDVDAEKLSERYFAPAEHREIMQSVDEERAKRFFRYWVAKEAALKALGSGLRGLSSCEIVLGASESDAKTQIKEGSHSPHEIRLRLLSCGKGWEAAVAAKNLDVVGQEVGYEQSGRRS